MFVNMVWSCPTRNSDNIQPGKYIRTLFKIVKNFLNNEGNLPYTLGIYKHSPHKKHDTVSNSKSVRKCSQLDRRLRVHILKFHPELNK
jgi:hypothetical protein